MRLSPGHLPRIGLAAVALVLTFLLVEPGSRAQEARSACRAGVDLLEALPQSEVADLEREAAAIPNGGSRLFRIRREGVRDSHLFGTMHLADPRVLSLPSAAGKAFRRSDTLVVETLDVADEVKGATAILARPDLMLIPDGGRIDDLVPADRREALDAVLADSGMPLGAVRTLQPWLVATTLAVPPCEAKRLAKGLSMLDVDLMERAEDAGKTVAGLETATEQLEALASMPMELQVENLLATVDLLDRLPDLFETMTALYLDGRIGLIMPALDHLAADTLQDPDLVEAYADFEERVVTARNRTMAERLGAHLDAGGRFVAVGALHLPGEEGLVELLRARGWTVEPVL